MFLDNITVSDMDFILWTIWSGALVEGPDGGMQQLLECRRGRVEDVVELVRVVGEVKELVEVDRAKV